MTTDQKYTEGLKSPDSKWHSYRVLPPGSIVGDVTMSNQEICARALDCAVRLYVGLNHGDPTTVVEQAEEFEVYIRDEK